MTMSDDLRLKIIGCEIDADLVKPEVWFYNQRVYERAIERIGRLTSSVADLVSDAARRCEDGGLCEGCDVCQRAHEEAGL